MYETQATRISKREQTRHSRNVIGRRLRGVLCERFPQTFFPKSAPRKLALKLGIHRDILERCPDIGAAPLRFALAIYTYGPKYAKALAPGAPRVDLDGRIAGRVSKNHAKFAPKSCKIAARP